MRDEVTVHVDAPPEKVWDVVTDVTRIGEYSPETFEAEWLDGATGPEVGARFRGHVKRNERGPVYWTVCKVIACEPPSEFGFAVKAGGRTVNTWRYQLRPAGGGTDVTESYELADSPLSRLYWRIAGTRRRRFNQRNMLTTLERMKRVIEGS